MGSIQGVRDTDTRVQPYICTYYITHTHTQTHHTLTYTDIHKNTHN